MEEAADINQQAVSGAAPGVAHAPRRARVAALLLALALPGAHAHASCALGVALPSDRPATTVSTASALEQAVRAANRTGHRRILLRDGRYVLRHTLVIRAPADHRTQRIGRARRRRGARAGHARPRAARLSGAGE